MAYRHCSRENFPEWSVFTSSFHDSLTTLTRRRCRNVCDVIKLKSPVAGLFMRGRRSDSIYQSQSNRLYLRPSLI